MFLVYPTQIWSLGNMKVCGNCDCSSTEMVDTVLFLFFFRLKWSYECLLVNEYDKKGFFLFVGLGGLKLWEGSLDLVKTLYNEIQEGKLSLKGKRVLEVRCSFFADCIFEFHVTYRCAKICAKYSFLSNQLLMKCNLC